VSKLLRTVKVAHDVGNLTTECGIGANMACLWRVDKTVTGWNHDFVVVLRVTEILCDLFEIFHMLVGGVSRLSNVLSWPECFFVAVLDLSLTVLLHDYLERGLLEGVTDSVVAALAEECVLDGGASLHRVRLHVPWLT